MRGDRRSVMWVGKCRFDKGLETSMVGSVRCIYFIVQGEFFAINDFCPHMGASLSDGHVSDDGCVMCPWHAWSFSINDGTWMDNRKSGIRTQTYEVRVQDGQIQVLVPPPDQPKSPGRDSAEDGLSEDKRDDSVKGSSD